MLPIQGPPDPKDDHHEDETISAAAEKIYRQRECIHDYEEIVEGLLVCRHCDAAKRIDDRVPADLDDPNTIVLLRFSALPDAAPTVAIRFGRLPEELQQFYREQSERVRPNTSRSGG